MREIVFLSCIVVLFFSCGEEPIPKPEAFLRLEYPKPQYKSVSVDLPFTFDKNVLAKNVNNIKVSRDGKSLGLDIVYPSLKGTIYLTYKTVTKDNLRLHLIDAQNLTQKHTQKADEIEGGLYENLDKKVFGMFYEVGGNAASQSQFYVTDSTKHFITGSLYFYTKPNYDSIFPAADYLKNDIKHLMESIAWKN